MTDDDLSNKLTSGGPAPAVALAHVPADFEPSWIVYEDDDVVVIHKPAGVPSQSPDEASVDDIRVRLRRFLAERDGMDAQDVYLGVHQRLDTETSGLLLFTRAERANGPIARQFESRTVKKRYVAAVLGYQGGDVTLKHAVAKGRGGQMRVVASDGRGDERIAVTHVSVAARHGDRSLLSLGCETGRTHQLRLQLAHHGAPIAGDALYGGPAAPRMLLHAEQLEFTLPSGQPLKLRAAAPEAFQLWLDRGMPERLDGAAIAAALPSAIQRRFSMLRSASRVGTTTCFRLAHREADGLPGVALEVFGPYLVAHLFDEALDAEAELLHRLAPLGFAGVYVKRHPKQKNTLVDPRGAALCPSQPLLGSAAPEAFDVFEYGVPFGVRLGDGLRTGLFLDQRENRRRVAAMAAGKRVLNLFAYTGGFSTAALAAGARSALCVDASGAALKRAEENVAKVGASERHRTWAGDVFDILPRLAKRKELFDLIVLDPPSYSTTKRRRFRASKDYAELAGLCLAVLAPGGHLMSCLNHHQVSQSRLRAMVAQGAEEACVPLSSHRDLTMGRDFPNRPGQEPLFKTVLSQRDG